MSLAARRDSIRRALAAAIDGRDAPYAANEKYTIADEYEPFVTSACELLLTALHDGSIEEREARRAERRAARRPKPKPTGPQRKGKARVVPLPRGVPGVAAIKATEGDSES